MKYKLKLNLKVKIFTVMIMVNSLFLGLLLLSLYISYTNKKNSLFLQQNIDMQYGLTRLKDLLQKDIYKSEDLVEQSTEENIDFKWKEHQQISEDINNLVSLLQAMSTPESSDVLEVKNAYTNIILPAFKDLYKVKIRQTISTHPRDSSSFESSVSGSIVDLQADLKSKVYAIMGKISRSSDNIELRVTQKLDSNIKKTNNDLFQIVALALFIITFSTLLFYVFLKVVFRSLTKLKIFVQSLERGDLNAQLDINTNDEIGEMSRGLTRFVAGLKNIVASLKQIGESDFTHEYTLLSEEDTLGQAYVKMKANLQLDNEKALKMKEQEDLQNWATVGIARFGEILRLQTNDNKELSYNIIKALIDYVNAIQGGIFIMNDESESSDPFLELMATYAYGRKKFKQKTMRFGEGLVGTCAIEGQSIYLTNIPPGYIEIESYLGHSNPKSLLLVPLKLDDKIFGVIEIASFNLFRPHEIKFIEDLAGTIASTIATSRINHKTAELLEKSKQQSEAMLAQEEEMRQNLEELQSTQEEAHRREKILHEDLESARVELEALRKELLELKNK